MSHFCNAKKLPAISNKSCKIGHNHICPFCILGFLFTLPTIVYVGIKYGALGEMHGTDDHPRHTTFSMSWCDTFNRAGRMTSAGGGKEWLLPTYFALISVLLLFMVFRGFRAEKRLKFQIGSKHLKPIFKVRWRLFVIIVHLSFGAWIL